METFRCHVNDVDQALPFYRALGFRLVDRLGPPFAVVQRARLVVWLCAMAPAHPSANRLVLQVRDLAQLRARLRRLEGAVPLREQAGAGGLEALWLDPAGNTVELFQPLEGAPQGLIEPKGTP